MSNASDELGEQKKRRFERWLIQRPPVLRTVNWLRRRHGQPPLEF